MGTRGREVFRTAPEADGWMGHLGPSILVSQGKTAADQPLSWMNAGSGVENRGEVGSPTAS